MHYQHKILSQIALKQNLAVWKKLGFKVVFTNGCFDLLHLGHLETLIQSKQLGDILIVGVNSDSSVKKLKGVNRPIQDEKTRLAVLAGLMFTDGVILFEEETPFELIQLIKPDVLVKGGDYKVSDIVGADIVIKNGGEVKTIPLVQGASTTASIKKMSKNLKI